MQRKTRNLPLPLATLKHRQRSKRGRRSSSPLLRLELPRRSPKLMKTASSWPKPPQRPHLFTVWGPVPLAPIKRAKGMPGFLHRAPADYQYSSSLLRGRQRWTLKESVCILHSDFLSTNYPLQGRTYLPREATARTQVMMMFFWLAKTQAKALVVIL